MRARVTPNCCEESEQGIVFLVCPDSIYDGDLSEKPTWRALFTNSKTEFRELSTVYFCPHCGKPLPDVEFKPDKNVKYVVMSQHCEGYCQTCGERLRCCECTPPEFRWKIINEP